MAQKHQYEASGGGDGAVSVLASITPKIKFMLFSIIQFLNLVAFAFVVGQPIFYLLALTQVQKDLKGSAYVELRNMIDRSLRISMRVVYYGALTTSFLLVIVAMKSFQTVLFITSLVALLALIADMYFMFKGNLPVNKAINGWSPENYPADWEAYRAKWFTAFKRRQVADFIGFGSLLIGAVFQ